MTRVALATVRAYRLVLAPFVGGGCRFHPSCSEYAEQVIARDGPWRGGLRALRRVLRVRRGLCPKCAYPMGESAVCSECGQALPKRLRPAT